MPELFGFSFGKKKSPDEPASNVPSFVPPDYEDGATTVSSGGFYGSYLDLDGGQNQTVVLSITIEVWFSNQKLKLQYKTLLMKVLCLMTTELL